MKTKKTTYSVLLMSTGAVAFLGCAPLSQSHQRVNAALARESQALTTGVVDALSAVPGDLRSDETTLALQLARQDQRIEGLPVQPLDVSALLSTNAAERSTAQADLQERFTEQSKWMQTREQVEQKLLVMGEDAEQQAARKKRFWSKLATAIVVPLAGVIALGVFVPVALPIFGRVLAWVVSKLPRLAGSLGVVSVRAFDAVVRGIEKTRPQPAAPAVPGERSPFPNETSRRASEALPSLDQLENNLGRVMDQAHKQLVRERKQALGLA